MKKTRNALAIVLLAALAACGSGGAGGTGSAAGDVKPGAWQTTDRWHGVVIDADGTGKEVDGYGGGNGATTSFTWTTKPGGVVVANLGGMGLVIMHELPDGDLAVDGTPGTYKPVSTLSVKEEPGE